MRSGFNELGDVLHGNMQKVSKTNDTISSELGTINSDMSLTTDSFTSPIPQGDYMVDIRLTSNHGFTLTGSGTHSGHESGNGSHTHSLNVRTLKAGDRVLVSKVGKERIVTAIVTSSKNI